MSRYLWIIEVILVLWAISDCVERRESRFWILVVIIFPLAGALLYFAYTRNWLGRFPWAMVTGRAGARGPNDFAGEGTPAALQKMGDALVRRGRYPEAVAVFERLLESEGPSVPPEARFDIAMAYKALGRFRDARDQLSLIVGRDPRFHAGEALLELADCHGQMRETEQARTSYEQLLGLMSLPEARYRYGVLLDGLGQKSVAAEQMKRLLDDLDKSPEFHQQKNRRFAKLAEEYLRKAEGRKE